MKQRTNKLLALLLAFLLSLGTLTACDSTSTDTDISGQTRMEESSGAKPGGTAAESGEGSGQNLGSADDSFDASQVPGYTGSIYTVIHDNIPYFTKDELKTEAYEFYSELDSYGRCGVAEACVCRETMPTEKRGSISEVKPSGWHTARYDSVDGEYLYNRCHLLGFQLTGENANKQNLITGTRYFNTEGMLPFENMVADYVKETDNHVMYRVTPVFSGSNLLASGVLMEAYSVEDDGDSICFCVFVYNVQPGIGIDYASGESWQESDAQAAVASVGQADTAASAQAYVLNENRKKFHYPSCASVSSIKNPKQVTATRQELIDQGYSACGNCKP